MYHRQRQRRHGRMGGSKVGDWLRKAGQFIKNNHLLSKGLNFAAGHTGAFGPVVSALGGLAASKGYGRRKTYRRRVGHGLNLAGMGYRRRYHY